VKAQARGGARAAQPAEASTDDGATSAQPPPPVRYVCASTEDADELAWVCLQCAQCLCVEDPVIKIPKYALAYLMWLGREHVLMQKASLGLRMLLGGGRAIFRKLPLGKGPLEDRESGLAGNHVLVAHSKPMAQPMLPPTAEQLSEHFVAVFCESPDDLEKGQFLQVNREDYKTLAQLRCDVNPAFAETKISMDAVERWPVSGVPEEIRRCGMLTPEAERMEFLGTGPGAVKGPVDAAAQAEDPDQTSCARSLIAVMSSLHRAELRSILRKQHVQRKNATKRRQPSALIKARILVWFNMLLC